jgi:hypothetical protein
MIRGGGPKGRSGFAAHEPAPEGLQRLQHRRAARSQAGEWNVEAVVAKADDYKSMLGLTNPMRTAHTLARLALAAV